MACWKDQNRPRTKIQNIANIDSMDTIEIIIADDHQMFLEGICALFQDVPEVAVVSTALNGREVMETLKRIKVDIVVTDISMPEMDGVNLSKSIKKMHPDIKVLVLSTYNDSTTIGKCIEHGVDGYLLKNAEKQELLKALQTIAKGERYFGDEVKKEYMKKVFSPRETEPSFRLSRREKEILKYIALEYTTQEIAEALFISQHTVNTHRKNLLSKLNAKNAAGLVKYAIQQGLLDNEK